MIHKINDSAKDGFGVSGFLPSSTILLEINKIALNDLDDSWSVCFMPVLTYYGNIWVVAADIVEYPG